MQNLEQVIKLIEKMVVSNRVWDDGSTHQQVINHTLEQQGIQRVIKILKRLDEGDENLIEVMKTLK